MASKRRCTLLSLTATGLYIYFTGKKIQLARNCLRINDSNGISDKQWSSEFNGLPLSMQLKLIYGLSKQQIRSLRGLDIEAWIIKYKVKINSDEMEIKLRKFLTNAQDILLSNEFNKKKSEYKDLEYVIWINKHSEWVNKTNFTGKQRGDIGLMFWNWMNLPENGRNPLGKLIYFSCFIQYIYIV